MKAVYALYADGHDAQRAVSGLRAAGFSDREITVITCAPMEEFEFSHIDSKNSLWYVASGGAVVGLAASTWLTRMSELAWPISVGNMPIVAWWPNLIVMFEMTMLGAILATVVTLMVTAGLLRRQPALYDPEVTSGKILVGVENTGQDRMADLERALLSAPDAQLRTIDR